MLDHARVDQVVVAHAPLRIPLGGGGTDLPSHYREHGGYTLSASIDRHVHVLLSTAFAPRFRLKHLEWEEVEDAAEIRHPILRAAIAEHWRGRPFELASVCDVPPGTGLGSSSSYTVCVLAALAAAHGERLEPERLAARAYAVEAGLNGDATGKRDQYAAALGGVNALELAPDGSARVEQLELAPQVVRAARERLLLFFTGERRAASRMLTTQVERSGDPAFVRNLMRTGEVARAAAAAWRDGDLGAIGELMREQWALKRERLPEAITERGAELHRVALGGGATGAVLAGAGGGGFLLVHSDEPERLRTAMAAAGAPELPFAIEPRGCRAGPA
jgi:D-glycero-alpha-D-manno-heptose-7-phosphate kinase